MYDTRFIQSSLFKAIHIKRFRVNQISLLILIQNNYYDINYSLTY